VVSSGGTFALGIGDEWTLVNVTAVICEAVSVIQEILVAVTSLGICVSVSLGICVSEPAIFVSVSEGICFFVPVICFSVSKGICFSV